MCIFCEKPTKKHYTFEFYLDQIEDIVSRFNNPFLGSDIITGFAGETEEDFEVTVENILKSKLSKIHVFPYSVRKGTLAERMSGHLPDSIKEERAEVIKKISQDKYNEFINRNIGTAQEVLIEKRPDKNSGKYKGVTRNYLNVLLDEGEFNTLQSVILSKENLLKN